MNHRDTACCLLIDEISLKTNLQYDNNNDIIVGYEDLGNGNRGNRLATSALAFMIRGISSNWCQPLGYVFSSSACKADQIKQLMYSCLSKCKEIGLNVLVVVSDQGPNFQQLTNLLQVSITQPYFFHNDSKYFYMFDTPHLLKSIRNNLHKYDFHFSNRVGNMTQIAKWDVINISHAYDTKTLEQDINQYHALLKTRAR
jgi:hypothetical protein